MRLLLLFTLWCTQGFAATCENELAASLKSHFRLLTDAGRLIGQQDPRLGQRGLLDPNGGLCAPTCGVNVLHAAFGYLGRDAAYFRSNSADVIRRLVDHISITWKENARMGVHLGALVDGLNHLADLGGLELNAVAYGHNRHYREHDLVANRDTVLIASISTVDPAIAHAIVILGVERQSNTLIFADPNFPTQTYKAKYEPIFGSSAFETVRLNISEHPHGNRLTGEILELASVQVVKNTLSESDYEKYQPLIGQSVRLTYRNGNSNQEVLYKVLPKPKYPGGPSGLEIGHTLLGHQFRAVVAFSEIASIEPVNPPKNIDHLKSLGGQTAHIAFDGDPRHSGELYFISHFVPPNAHYPMGGLEVSGPASGVIPVESITSLKLFLP